jgi:SAM-dependent methyltransferase
LTAPIFDEAPSLYDRFRPGYPEAAVEALIDLAKVPRNGTVLEVGAGTGQLTLPLVRCGLRVTALEPGPRMADLLVRKLDSFPASRVVVSRFEDAVQEPSAFDLVASATAFHWVKPELRYTLAARLLRPGGALALVRNDHVATPANAAYYQGVRPIYERHAPDLAGGLRLRQESEVAGFADEMDASGIFRVIAQRQFGWDRPYASAELIGLLRTYSDHRRLPHRVRAALLRDIRAFVDAQLGGKVEDRYVTTLCVGRTTRRADVVTDHPAKSGMPLG